MVNLFQIWVDAKKYLLMIADEGFSESFNKCWQNIQMNFSFFHTVLIGIMSHVSNVLWSYKTDALLVAFCKKNFLEICYEIMNFEKLQKSGLVVGQ